MRTHSDEWNTERNDLRRPAGKVVAPSVGGPTREAPVPSLDRDTLLSLQSTIGNAGVERLIRSRVDVPHPRAAGATLAIQRESDDEGQEEDDPIKKGIEQVGGAVKKKVESATDLPTFEVDLDTAGSEFFDEMAADIEDVNKALARAEEYLKYVKDAVEYYDEWGKGPPLGPAVDGLEKISVGVSAGLGKWKDRAEWGSNGAKLASALYQHYRTTSKLRFDDTNSIQAWIEANKRLHAASKPFAQSLLESLAKAGMNGSAAASQATIVGGYLFVMGKLAIEAVEAGTKAMNPAFKRLKKLERDTGDAVAPPPPRPPAPWMSRAEENRRAAGIERRKVEDRATRERMAIAEDEEAARKSFAASAFRGTYRAQREWLKARILEAIRGPMGELGHTWWSCFMVGGQDAYDEVRGESIHGVLDDPDESDLDAEIEEFMNVKPPCPYFTQIFDRAFTRHRQGVGAGAAPVGR